MPVDGFHPVIRPDVEGAERVRVLHLVTELNVGGAERMLEKLLTRLDPRVVEARVVSMTDVGPIGRTLRGRGIPVSNLGMRPGRPTLSGVVRLLVLMRHRPVDIVHSWLYHADLLGLVVGKLMGAKPVIWSIRCSDMDFARYGALTRFIARLNGVLSPLADIVTVNSCRGRRVHEAMGYAPGRMVMMPNGFDTAEFRPSEDARCDIRRELGIPGQGVSIGMVGRWDPMKDHANFSRAAAKVASRHPQVHFVLGGGRDRCRKPRPGRARPVSGAPGPLAPPGPAEGHFLPDGLIRHPLLVFGLRRGVPQCGGGGHGLRGSLCGHGCG